MSDDQRAHSRTVTVAVAPNEIVAKMWQQVLQDEGIVAALKPAGAGHSFATTALVEHYVQVLSNHADRAREIIDELESEDDSLSSSDTSA
jgi:uncharacterized membrane protein YvbJ